MSEMMRKHRWFVLIVLLYLAVAILYGVTIPVFESPDAGGHYAYIHELTEGRGLPVQGRPSGRRVTGYVASHPPLYYALSAALTFWNHQDVDFSDWAWRNPYHASGFPGSVGNKNFLIHTDAEAFLWRGTPLTVHLARLVSALLGAVAVVGTFGTAWELTRAWGRSRPGAAVAAASLTAFNPMFVFTGARVSNDAAVAAFGSLVIWGATRLAVRGLSRRGLALLGAALGLAALSKLSGVVLGPAVALALLLNGIRRAASPDQPARYPIRALARRETLVPLLFDGLILFGTAAILCGWWFVRNLLLYGELMGVGAWLSHTETVRQESIGLFAVIPQLEGLEMSFWAMFGWFNIPVAPWMYRFWWALVRLALIGLGVLLIEQSTRRRLPPSVRAGLAVLMFSVLLVFGSVWRFIMIVLGAQGRYLLPAVAAISTLLVLGLTRLVGRRAEGVLAGGLMVTHLAATLASLFLFILPAYAQPRPVAGEELPEEMVRFDARPLETSIRLIGGVIEAEEARPGENVPVSLYWEAQSPPAIDYVTHVRLLGRDGERVGGMDGYPGRGTFPPTLWESGTIYRDTYLLPVDDGAKTPTLIGLEAGLRVRGGAPLTLTLPSGEPWPGTLLLDVVPLRSIEQPSDYVDYPIGARLGGEIVLVGADMNAETFAPGNTVAVTLVWRAETEVEEDYTIFVHLLDEDGQLVAQIDEPPFGGGYPTFWWAQGEIVRDAHHLALPSDLPPGRYDLKVGLYESTSGARLTATDGEGNPFAQNTIPVVSLEIQ